MKHKNLSMANILNHCCETTNHTCGIKHGQIKRYQKEMSIENVRESVMKQKKILKSFLKKYKPSLFVTGTFFFLSVNREACTDFFSNK